MFSPHLFVCLLASLFVCKQDYTETTTGYDMGQVRTHVHVQIGGRIQDFLIYFLYIA